MQMYEYINLFSAKPDVNNICEIGSSLKKCITEQMEKVI